MKILVSGLLLFSCCVASAFAIDANKTFAIRGIGAVTCETYLRELEQKSNAAFMIHGWLDGYITATSQHLPDTYDALSFETTDLVANLVASHCKNRPEDRMYEVVGALVMNLQDDRLRTQSPRLTARVGEIKFAMYAEVLQRVQRKLASLGLYYGEPEPEFGQKTREALAAFQRSNNIQPTGLPDQPTLWRLLRQSQGNPALR